MTKRQETSTGLTGRNTRFAAGTAVLLATVLLTGCGGKDATESAPQKVDGTAAPAGGEAQDGKKDGGEEGDSATGSGGTEEGTDDGSDSGNGTSGDPSATAGSSGGSGGSDASQGGGDGAPAKTACHTSDLKASVGRNNPGAGQVNFPLVLTNNSERTCTVHGFPGLAFVDSEGNQVSVDPVRTDGDKATVKLTPGSSAWAPLSYSNPEVTGVPTVDPADVVITPPDERAGLQIDWTGGPVTRTGKASVPKIGPLAPGTGV